MEKNSLGKSKGQYFSFDAIIATVIIVIAMTSLLTYWFAVQSVVDAKSNYLQAAAMSMADTLMSPGIPENWQIPVTDPTNGNEYLPVQQIGFTNGYTNDINESKVQMLQLLVNNANPADASAAYVQVKNLFHLGGAGEEFYLIIQQTNDPSISEPNIIEYRMGCGYPADAQEVAIAYRGGTWVHNVDLSLQPKPVRVSVAVWRQNQANLQPCPG
ncbi:MAG: hypothetical protein NTV88_03430 [Candidatus Micrarchaeota archaeon]|nr:hypothetical protein [Candidatus Micrarchaeota archaeon]